MNDSRQPAPQQDGTAVPEAQAVPPPGDTEELRRRLQPLLEQGRHAQALELLRQSDAANGDPELLFLKARLLANGGDYRDALQACDRVLATLPDAQAVLALRVGLQVLTGDHVGALETADRILARHPDDLNALINKSTALLNSGRSDECIALAERVIALDPNRAEGYLNKGAVLLRLGLADWALQVTEQGLRVAPDHPQLAVNRIGALLELHRPQEALAAMEALSGMEADFRLRLHRTEALRLLGRGDEALEGLLELLAEADCPDWVGQEALRGLLGRLTLREAVERIRAGRQTEGVVARTVLRAVKEVARQRRYDELAAGLEAARAAGADPWELDLVRAFSLATQGRAEEAEAFFTGLSEDQAERAALLYDGRWQLLPPDSAFRHDLDPARMRADYLLERLKECDWDLYAGLLQELDGLIGRALEGTGRVPIPTYWSLHLPMDRSVRRRIAERHAGLLERYAAANLPRLPVPEPPLPDGRLKIGYVSADFRNHATAHLMRSMFALHDRSRFEVYGYALRSGDGSRYTRDIRDGMDHFVPLWGLSNAEAARRIREDGIHILVDIHGYTHLARLEVFAQRPAPIQVEFLAYPGTTGAAFFDYAVADRTVMPPAHGTEFTESLLCMPDCYQVNDRWQPISSLGLTRRLVGLPERGVIYCAFNRPEKFDPPLFRCWMEILRQVEGSVLWCLHPGTAAAENLRAFAHRCGVDGGRLVFASDMPKPNHLERIGLADLYLDTLLYNGHTSASDALWAGVPVLTLPGGVFQSRVGASLVRAAGLPELVMADLDQYRRTAVALGCDPERLGGLKTRLRETRLDCSLFDTRRYVRNLEQGLILVWQRHQRSEPPSDIDIGECGDSVSIPGSGMTE